MVSFDRKWFANCVTAGLVLCAVLLVAVEDADAAKRRVSVSGQNVYVADILRDVAEQAKVQLVLTAGVDAKVPMVSIRNKPWDEAMRQIAAKAGLHVWIEGDCAVVSKDKLGAQLRLSLVPEVSPPTKVTLNYERTAMTVVLEKIALEAGISILILPGKGEDLIAAKLPGRRTISINVRNIHWRKALELVARSTGCRVETIADGTYAVSSMSVVIKAVDRSVRDIINDISEQSGINVVVSPKVKGNVTVNLDGVPWAEALDAIVTSLGLSWRQYRENTVIVTGEPIELKTAIGYYDVNYLSLERVRGALGAMIGFKEAWEMLGPSEGVKPPFVIMLKLEPHMLRAMEGFLGRYDKPTTGTPIEFDLSRLRITVDTPEGTLEYDPRMPDVRKMLFYRKFRRAITPVLSEQGETSFVPIVDKVMVRDVPRNLTYVEQIVAGTFPPMAAPDPGKRLIMKEYPVSVANVGDMAKVLRAQVKPGLDVTARDREVVVSATVREHKRVQEILAAYDVDVVRREYNVLYKPIDTLVPLLKSRLSPLSVIETDPLTKTVIIEGPMPDQTYTEKFMRVQDVPAADAISVKIFKLNFVKAEQLAATLKSFLESTAKMIEKAGVSESETSEALEGMSEGEFEGEEEKPVVSGKAIAASKIEAVVLADVVTNSLIVTASGADMPKIQNLIETLDMEPRQVLIIGRIVETTVDNLSDIGLEVNLAGRMAGAAVPTTIPFDKRQIRLYDDIVPDKHPDYIGTETGDKYPASSLFGYPAFETKIEAFRGFGLLSFGQLGATLAMLDRTGETELISSPRIVIVDNETAIFKVTKSREYRKRGSVTEGDGGQIAFEYEYATADSKISIEVTPQITPNGKILMTLKPEVVSFSEWDIIENPDGTTDKLPTMVTRTTETKVIVDDGMTLVLAGLVENVKASATSQVPFLGKIPVLGRLFRKEYKKEEGRNLIFFFTPIIMKDDRSHEVEIAGVKTAYEKLGDVEKTEIIEWNRGIEGAPRKKMRTLVRSAADAADKPKKGERRRR